MNRLVFALLLLCSSASFAGTGDAVPLCPPGAPADCVVPNWGQINPGEGNDASIANDAQRLASTSSSPRSMLAVRMMPTAASLDASSARGSSPIRSVVSPRALFPNETAALLSALKRARFNEDGSIRTGEAAIRRAAAAAARSAGKNYTLTLYIKVSQKLGPDRSATLGKKVEALNAVLGSPADSAPSGTPKT